MHGLVIQQHQMMEENVSNLTSASGEASVSSNQQSSFASHNPTPAKKKRSLPGNPDPDAEVIALSPRTLLATNRFVCDICNKGFQRDQNLQLHRRGHNLPWKLKQRTSKDVKKKVYICPEVSCVHHDPSRALGDLTGIKKHFCRKHGEKKWKCDKCSKKYAVQSDWKAHGRTCGTREYRCDCGTLFSRRDSFITHRAFCDALAEEGARTISPANPMAVANHHQMVGFQQPAPHEISTLPNTTVQTQFPQMIRTTEAINSSMSSSTASRHSFQELSHQQQNFNLKPEMPPWVACQGPGPPTVTSLHHIDLPLPSSIYSTRSGSGFSQENPSPHHPAYELSTSSPHLSATALLRKAAEMGATMSRPTNHGQMAANTTSTSGFGVGFASQGMSGGGGFAHGSASSTTAFLLDMASLTSAPGLNRPFEEAFGGMLGPKREGGNAVESFSRPRSHGRNEEGGGSDAMTRDFLGLRAFSHRDILNMAGPDPCINSSYQQPKQDEEPWQG